MRVLMSHAGRHGDALWALATVRAVAETIGEKVDFVISAKYGGLAPLIREQEYIGNCYVDPEWQVVETAPITPAEPPELDGRMIQREVSPLEPPIAPLLDAQAPKTSAPSAKSAVPTEVDGGWPRDYATPSAGLIRIFQPQVASWDGQRHMVMYAAVSYTAKGAAKPALGTVKIEAGSSVAVEDRLVNFTDVKLTESNFPGMPNDQLKEVVARIQDVEVQAWRIRMLREPVP